MRLLKLEANGEFSLTNDITNPTTPYAILSHTWGEDNKEVTFADLKDSSGKTKDGYKKLRFCGQQAACDGLQYFWVDTCCIDKSNSNEISEAINSMFRWYRNAAKCYVYLTDVMTNDRIDLLLQPWEAAFRNSRWFTRGWTLQELIAPTLVEFFCSNGQRLGDKKSLEQQLHEITGIAVPAIQGAALSDFDVNERMSWARDRETKRPEDRAYSLLGIFGIHMPLIYGEGMINALSRLQLELDRRANKQLPDLSRNPILNPHPVRRNYRKVIVLIIYWEVDQLETAVSLYALHRLCYALKLYRFREYPMSSGNCITMKYAKSCLHSRSNTEGITTGLGPTTLILMRRIFRFCITSVALEK
jgi:hypothetical protein